MNAPRPVTDADKLAAWHAFYNDASLNRMRDPNPNAPGAEGWSDGITLAALQRVLVADRARVAAATPSTTTAGPTLPGEKEQC